MHIRPENWLGGIMSQSAPSLCLRGQASDGTVVTHNTPPPLDCRRWTYTVEGSASAPGRFIESTAVGCRVGYMANLTRLLETHMQFEAAAADARMTGAKRSIIKSRRGVLQHVVETKTAILRWPCSYAGISKPKTKVRYLPLMDRL